MHSRKKTVLCVCSACKAAVPIDPDSKQEGRWVAPRIKQEHERSDKLKVAEEDYLVYAMSSSSLGESTARDEHLAVFAEDDKPSSTEVSTFLTRL